MDNNDDRYNGDIPLTPMYTRYGMANPSNHTHNLEYGSYAPSSHSVDYSYPGQSLAHDTSTEPQRDIHQQTYGFSIPSSQQPSTSIAMTPDMTEPADEDTQAQPTRPPPPNPKLTLSTDFTTKSLEEYVRTPKYTIIAVIAVIISAFGVAGITAWLYLSTDPSIFSMVMAYFIAAYYGITIIFATATSIYSIFGGDQRQYSYADILYRSSSSLFRPFEGLRFLGITLPCLLALSYWSDKSREKGKRLAYGFIAASAMIPALIHFFSIHAFQYPSSKDIEIASQQREERFRKYNEETGENLRY